MHDSPNAANGLLLSHAPSGSFAKTAPFSLDPGLRHGKDSPKRMPNPSDIGRDRPRSGGMGGEADYDYDYEREGETKFMTMWETKWGMACGDAADDGPSALRGKGIVRFRRSGESVKLDGAKVLRAGHASLRRRLQGGAGCLQPAPRGSD